MSRYCFWWGDGEGCKTAHPEAGDNFERRLNQ